MKTVCTLALVLAFSSATIAADPFPLDGAGLRKISRPFPFKAEFSNRVSFRLPDSLRYVNEDKLSDFADRMKLAHAGDEVGIVAPDDMSWYTTIFLPKDDPLTDQTDMTNINKDQIATWNEKFTNDHTPRRGGAGKTWRLGNWTHQPVWDAGKKVLSFGTRMTTESGEPGSDLVNYKVFIYGPENQIIGLQTITPVGTYQKPVERTQKLIEEVTFPSPHTESSASDEMMYYAKLAGGGLLGATLVIIFARMLMGGGRRSSTAGVARRPGLPR